MNLVHTYSIVAISEDKSELGVAVQSHWFAVGAVCPWIKPGVGVITTQSMVEISYGQKGLGLMSKGKMANQALEELLAQDNERELRQVAMIDAAGTVATHTGSKCIAEAGHFAGENYSVQANMMLKDTVWPAMAEAYEKSKGNLSLRLFAALQAAQAEGGDIRGKQSAAMLVANNILDEKPWSHITTNIRVDDHPEPLEELNRLMQVDAAYELMNEGDALIATGEVESANEKYSAAANLAPEIEELPFWEAITLADSGMIEKALPIFKMVFEKNQDWMELVRRLPASGLLPDDPELILKILSVGKEK